MKVTAVLVAGLLAVLVAQAGARSVAVEQVSSALQESFNSLNSKRNEWFENYSTMNNMTKTTNARLAELGLVSKMALPLMWYLYQMAVKSEKKHYPKLAESGEQSLPYHFETTLAESTLGLNYYLEATLILQNYRDFQVRILKDEEAIFFLNFNFNERRAVMGYTHNQEHTEKIVLEGDSFPDIQLYQPFRVNVQVMSDCIVASFWLTNLDLSVPMPLPEKHIWCTRDYSYGQDVSFDIDTLEAEDHQHHDSQDEQEQDSQEQDSQEENSHEKEDSSHEKEGSNEIKLVSTVIYNGFIYM